jgi:hypothetical protein
MNDTTIDGIELEFKSFPAQNAEYNTTAFLEGLACILEEISYLLVLRDFVFFAFSDFFRHVLELSGEILAYADSHPPAETRRSSGFGVPNNQWVVVFVCVCVCVYRSVRTGV